MKLVALINDDGKAEVQILDVPAKALVEVRLQNTFNGHVGVFVGTANNGVYVVPTDTFGQNFAPSVRVLTEDNQDSLDTLIFDATQSGANKLVYITNADYAKRTAPAPAVKPGVTPAT